MVYFKAELQKLNARESKNDRKSQCNTGVILNLIKVPQPLLFKRSYHIYLCLQYHKCSTTHTGDLPFPTEKWSKSAAEVRNWDDWLPMQGDLTPRLDSILSGTNMANLWKNASRARPDDADLRQSLWRIQSEFLSRVLTVGTAIQRFGLDPYTKPLTIHLAGASHNETMGARLTDYDELNNMFPGHQGIEIVMVGPEVVDGPIMRPPLRASGPKQRVYISAYKGLYHQFWEELVEKEEAAKPDLVVGFHPGVDLFPIMQRYNIKLSVMP